MSHNCVWCPVETRGLYAYAYNAVLALDLARSGLGDQARADRKLAELRTAVMDLYGPEVNEHFEQTDPRADAPLITRQEWDQQAGR